MTGFDGDNIALTRDQLAALIDARVAEALATNPEGPSTYTQPRVGTLRAFLECKPHPFDGTEGAIGLLHWIRRVGSAFEEGESPCSKRVVYATSTFQGKVFSWWNAQVQMLGLADANATPWDDFKDLIKEEFCHKDDMQKLEMEYYRLKMVGLEIEAYTKRSNDLAALCPNLSQPPYKRIALYLRGLVPEIQGSVIATKPPTIQQVIRLARHFTNQAVENGRLPRRVTATTNASDYSKRKWNDYQSGGPSTIPPQAQQRRVVGSKGPDPRTGGYQRKRPKCDKCGRHHNGPCARNKCQRCNKVGHEAKDCRSPHPVRQNQPQQQQHHGNIRGCFQCGAEGHIKMNCP
ncbi:uncharacterized protein LOC110866560 [Helianthus annuus]|uniref:uncharacterized protein LOC110866560 n=1 Tax=Helianthus annuus TaxID=4232 RepID=UPI000B8F7AC0|nr:uncharacterized protein LOC110866560 [Helianthus annuus]